MRDIFIFFVIVKKGVNNTVGDSMKSLWKADRNIPNFDALEGDINTDVLIIGGGIAGILCAHFLTERGVDCAVVEAQMVCSGVTMGTTAKITSQHGLIYDSLIRRFGIEYARKYFCANDRALGIYRRLCSNIDCDFEEKDSFVYSVDDLSAIKREIEAYKKIGVSVEFTNDMPIPVSCVGAIRLRLQAQFSPLKFLSALCPKLKIYENTQVLGIEGTAAVCDKGKIRANKIIVATHFPIFNKHGSYFLKMYQHRSYVIALENAANVNGMYVDENLCGMSFRNCGNLLLLGGGSHRTGKQGGSFKELEGFAKHHYPNASVKYRWATQDCMTLDSVPYIGRYSKNTESLFVATGFNKWGMTGSMVSAEILCDMLTGKQNEFADIFSPSRTILRPQLVCNAFESTVGLITPTTKRCTHLGCALKWNKYEHTWDCPCHGSRYSENGYVINTPAIKDLKTADNSYFESN